MQAPETGKGIRRRDYRGSRAGRRAREPGLFRRIRAEAVRGPGVREAYTPLFAWGESMDLRSTIRTIKDFPEEGILFRDITPLLAHHDALKESIQRMAMHFRDARIDAVVGIESRGFMFGAPLAITLGAGFVPVRKPGKLPSETYKREYALEYGTAALEIHKDALHEQDRVVICDDVLATGGTMAAAIDLVESVGAQIVGCAVLIELVGLDGRSKLGDHRVESLIRY